MQIEQQSIVSVSGKIPFEAYIIIPKTINIIANPQSKSNLLDNY